VTYDVVVSEKGPQADHLLPLGAQVAQQSVASDGADGTVSWYDVDKGFGFVTPESGGPDVFVHVRELADGLAVLGEACPGAQFMPAGHVASGFCSFERLGVAVCADAAPAAKTAPAIMLRRSLDMTPSGG